MFPLGIFRRVQHPAHLSPAQNASLLLFLQLKCSLPIFLWSFQWLKMLPAHFYTCMSNKCIAHFTGKVKWHYMTFIFNLEHCLDLFKPSHILQVCTGWKFLVLGFANVSFNHLQSILLCIIYFYLIVYTVGLVTVVCSMLHFIKSIAYCRKAHV